MEVKQYDGRAVWSGRLGDGTVIQQRPSPLTGRWVQDAFAKDGTPIYAGRPIAVGAEMFAMSAVRAGGLGTLTISGPTDPNENASLPSQGVSLDFVPQSA